MADVDALPENAAEIAVANAINNINGRNRVLDGGVGGGQNNMMNMRDRLFYAIYLRAAATYAELVPRWVQLAIEYMLLAKALVFFFTLVYVHNAFIKNPCTCLQDVQNWPREGVIRVEIIPNLAEKRAIWQSIKRDQQLIYALKDSYYYNIGPQTYENHYRLKRYESILVKLGLPLRPTFAYSNETLYYYFDAINLLDSYDHPNAIQLKVEDEDDEQYIVEYSLEYGNLRLSPATRKRLNIPVLTVQLDPNANPCFGDKLTRYLLKRLLGYDDLLMASVRAVAEQEENKGYLRNVITGEHYRFVSMWWAAWSSYPAAFCVMLLFTFSVSMLLRYSHHQIFVFIVDVLQMLEYNVSARFPIAPLLTVILALVGMEAIMSEFFNDTTTAFYIVLIVWVADQYDAICCHTAITKRHWLRFFYLYHFAFYAYHYRFSGQYRTLALLSSFLFIQHSMVFFFHRFELPAIMAQRNVFLLTRNQNGAAAGAGAAAAPGAGANGQQAAVERARVVMVRMFRQLAAQRAQNAAAAAGGGQVAGAGAQPRPQAENNATAAVPNALANLRRLPILGQWLQRQEQFPTVRRVFLGQGGNGGQMMHVHLHRINIADIANMGNQATGAANGQTNAVATAALATPVTVPAAADDGNEAAATNSNVETAEHMSTTTAQDADVETNQGRKTQNAPATTTTTPTNMNDLAAVLPTETAPEAVQKEQEDTKLFKQTTEQSLENLNSDATDIINSSMRKAINTANTSNMAAGAAAAAALDQAQAQKLDNNLPTNNPVLPVEQKQEEPASSSSTSSKCPKQLPSGFHLPNVELFETLSMPTTTKATAASASGADIVEHYVEMIKEKQSKPAYGQEIMNDQCYDSSKNKQLDAPIIATTAAGAGGATAAVVTTPTNEAYPTSKQSATEPKTLPKLATMMDGITTVDFIEGDSSTSARNYSNNKNRGTNHMPSSPDLGGLIKTTAEHTSNQQATITPTTTTTTTETTNI